MNELFDFFGRVLRGVLKLALGLAGLVFLLSLLLATLVVVLGVSIWSLLTGRKPAPAVLFTRFRESSKRYSQGAWPTGAGMGRRPMGDVVDVQATEVPDPKPADRAPRSGPDTMARVAR
ncbi:hypothetical protein [Hydrogenophaga sp. BPS33]|uniref:hypothetical protein n=1 Tax=Hydrogenophaga sp. BPS33 TaxID=2651974 RepID=UPI00132047AD|nr:hypothetical protein [Hydrogenophaga sp. BPS33]QHE88357.1 hypothetical protein F9K07_27480 [Hydrogenophaga sp. BPS33]